MNRFLGNIFFVVLILSGVVYACANRGYPQGGPKDEAPPEVVGEAPESFSTNFKGKRVYIYFNEYMQLKDINSKLIVSPPMKKNARVSLRGKYILMEFQDTLKPETTYSVDFGDALVDNNEGNPLGFYRYVFSTGTAIDTMEMSGKVVDAQTQLPLLGILVMLYENHADSAALVELPSYVAKTDSAGIFRVTNIKNTSYRVVALEDTDRNYMFMPENEKVGFVDSLAVTQVRREMRMDTIRPDTTKLGLKVSKKGEMTVENLTRDTVVEREYILFGPSNLYIPLFEEEKTTLYMVNEERPERERLELIFSVPGENELKAELLGVNLVGTLDPADWYLTERSATNDTISLWIKDTVVAKIDSLMVQLTYLRTDDSTKQRLLHTDTTRFVFKDKKKPETGRRKNDESEEEKPQTSFLEINVQKASPHHLNRDIVLNFDKPINPSGLDRFRLSEKVDTNWVEVSYQIKQDSLKIRRYYLQHSWKSETDYKLELDSMSLYSIYGLYNDKLENVFKTKPRESYGKIKVLVKGAKTPVIIQLVQGDKDVKIVRELWIPSDGELTFDYLDAGKYMMRAILDRNGNKKWDTGHYLKRIQPEEVKYLPVEIDVRENFDYQQEFDVSKIYVREDPAKKKKAQDDRNQNNR